MTESVLMQDTAETLATLRRLSRLGIRLAMDDFGYRLFEPGLLAKIPFSTESRSTAASSPALAGT